MFKMPIFQGITVLSYQSNYIIANLLYIHASGIIILSMENRQFKVLRKLRLCIKQCNISLRIPFQGLFAKNNI
jgi:hypothetical protein